MNHRIQPLTGDDIAFLPSPCRSCVFWELPKAPRGPQPDRAAEVGEAKHLWFRSMELEWGAPGVMLRHQQRTLGYAMFMPAEHAHRTRRLGTTPSDDALVLATLWVDPDARGAGVGTALLHRVLRQAHEVGLRAVEATGARATAGPCMIPEGFLLAQGFVVHHPHMLHPLLRLDLRQTARWHEAVEHALDSVRAALSRRDRRTVPSTS